ncbi:MAG: hypothetical protein CMM95_01055 [Rickettsiales bacterium]|nr:hypothetical protein [Rickettsiales bacterium]
MHNSKIIKNENKKLVICKPFCPKILKRKIDVEKNKITNRKIFTYIFLVLFGYTKLKNLLLILNPFNVL